MTRALGVDYSHWDGKVDFAKTVGSGANFVYIKASQGTWIDNTFTRNWQASKDVGLPRGSYCYLDWGWSEIEQAKLFVKTMGGDYGELPPVLDLEMDPAPYGLTAKLVSGKAWNFLKYVEGATGKIPMLYCGYYFWNSWGSNESRWTHFPFWLAWYAPEFWIRVPKPWTRWTFWQYTDRADGVAFGCQSKGVDANWFNGSVFDMQMWISGQSVPPVVPPVVPPIIPGSTYPHYITTVPVNVRDLPTSTGSKIIGTLPTGVIVEVDTVDTVNQRSHYVNYSCLPHSGWIWTVYTELVK